MRIVLAITLALLLAACDNGKPEAKKKVSPATAKPVVTLETRAWRQQSDSTLQAGATSWQQALTDFNAQPDGLHLAALRNALTQWYADVTANYLLLASRACANNQQAPLKRLDQWPLYPGYLDALPQWPDSGLINDPTVELSAAGLLEQHGATDDAEASLGFAALFVILNGTGAQQRALSAFTGSKKAPSRRREYLDLAGQQLLQDLDQLGDPALTNTDLTCGLDATLGRQQALTTWQQQKHEDSWLTVPATVLKTNQQHLFEAISSIPADSLSQWSKQAPGLQQAVKASSAGNWQPLQDWLHPPAKKPDDDES
ncbi:MAG: hypothetical protein R3292_02530 [Alcanivorax sp.]|nr:hypothetical protein [Alcanivorax sp.]